VEAVLGQLRDHQLLDDAAFASYWVEQRQAFRPRGAHVVRGELRRLGVKPGDLQAAVESLEPQAEELAFRAAQKRAGQLSELDERTFTTKLSQFLARRGFDWDTIAAVVRRLSHDRGHS